MFLSAVVLGTATLVPCHTVLVGDETGLALDCRSGGATSTGKTLGYSITIRVKSFAVQVAPDGRKKKVVRMLFSAFIGLMIFVHAVMLDGFAILDLLVKQSLQYTFLRGLNNNTSQHSIPVRDKRLQVLHSNCTLNNSWSA